MIYRKRELVFTSKTLIIQNANWLKDGYSILQRIRILLSWGKSTKIPTKERMRYIIHYRQTVNNTLEKEETPEIPVTGYIIGDQPKRETIDTKHPSKRKTTQRGQIASIRQLSKQQIFDSTKGK